MSACVVIGYRLDSSVRVISLREGMSAPLPLRLEWRDHSPAGLEWGYRGSAPHQLALSILGEVVGRDQALELYGDYCADVIAALPADQWYITSEEVLAWIAARTAGGRRE